MVRVLVVDDDPIQLRLTAEVARAAGYTPLTASSGREALKLLRGDPGIGVMILDLVMPDLDGMAVMEAMDREQIATPVIIQTAHSAYETVVSAMRKGAVDFFVKPVAPERMMMSLRNALKLGTLETALRTGHADAAPELTAASPAMHKVELLVRKVAKGAIPVLIEGESGSGKHRVARLIHMSGERLGKPFVVHDCRAADSLDDAFTAARGGTLYLAEIGELSSTAQQQLLALIDGVAARTNVRLIAGTSRRLLNLAKSGEIREDLYHRLNVLPVYVPPLRDRTEDIEPLAQSFLARAAAEARRPVVALAPEALALLRRHDWPHNVRELENALYRAVALAGTDTLTPADFPQILARLEGRDAAARSAAESPAPSAPVHIDAYMPSPRDLREAIPDRFLDPAGEVAPLAALERDLIAFALKHYGGRMSTIARALQIGRSTLYRKMHEYGLDGEIRSDAA